LGIAPRSRSLSLSARGVPCQHAAVKLLRLPPSLSVTVLALSLGGLGCPAPADMSCEADLSDAGPLFDDAGMVLPSISAQEDHCLSWVPNQHGNQCPPGCVLTA
jgi:hypothetical protein